MYHISSAMASELVLNNTLFLHSNSSNPSHKRIFGFKVKPREIKQTHFSLAASLRSTQGVRLRTSKEPFTQEITRDISESIVEMDNGPDLFDDLKQRFLSFKKEKYLGNLEHYQKLAKGQAPKFMVIACGDSRVCPSTILGFQPGEAFVVRNVANLVPHYEGGPSETNAALEFAVNSLEVENVLVMGHSCCGGIRALMSMEDAEQSQSSSFINSWVIVGKNALASTKASASDLPFDQQCRHCEQESVNHSLTNLLSYPWIEEKVMRGKLSLHGGYYDFIDCTFEKWTLDYRGDRSKENNRVLALKNRSFWR